MKNPINATAGCHLIGEYVDEADVPADAIVHRGDVVRPRVAADFLDPEQPFDQEDRYLKSMMALLLKIQEDKQ